jgi:hypothetical protein
MGKKKNNEIGEKVTICQLPRVHAPFCTDTIQLDGAPMTGVSAEKINKK